MNYRNNTMILPRRRATRVAEDTEEEKLATKVCPDCKEEKELSNVNFYLAGRGRRYFATKCKECSNRNQAARYQAIGRKRSKFELNPELRQKAQSLLNDHKNLFNVAEACEVSTTTVAKAIALGVLTLPVESKENDN